MALSRVLSRIQPQAPGYTLAPYGNAITWALRARARDRAEGAGWTRARARVQNDAPGGGLVDEVTRDTARVG